MTVRESDYIELEIPHIAIETAEDLFATYDFKRQELHKFGSEKERTLEGYIAQYTVADLLGVSGEMDSYEYDIVYHGKKLEIKTISCAFRPETRFEATINSCYSHDVHKQEADYYVFTRINYKRTVCWIVGFIRCDLFWERGRFVKKGEEVYPGQIFKKASGTVLPIKHLYPFRSLQEHLEMAQRQDGAMGSHGVALAERQEIAY